MPGDYEKFSKFIADNKGKRKFKQSVELAINFKGVDFTKQDSKLNLDILLPNGKGKVKKIAVFSSDRKLAEEARNNKVEVIDSTEIEAIGRDPARLNRLVDYDLIAQPQLMPIIAKNLGQFLGPRNRMPRPLIGNMSIASLANELSKRISVRNRGKNLPTVHCVVGAEDMDPKQLYDNINEVLSNVSKKVGSSHVKSVYVKLTMSEPMKFM